MLQWIIVTLHLLALPLGLCAVWARSRALRLAHSEADLRGVFAADNVWALAAVLWIATGLLRAFGGFEKGGDYYLHALMFHIKLTLFVLVFALELRPMVTLMRWRSAVRKGQPVDLAVAKTLATIGHVQMLLVILMAFAATALARGLFFRG